MPSPVLRDHDLRFCSVLGVVVSITKDRRVLETVVLIPPELNWAAVLEISESCEESSGSERRQDCCPEGIFVD